VSVTYTIRNVSTTPVPGDWVDSLYLSDGVSLDAGDLLIGRVEHIAWSQRTFEELGERYELARTFLWTARILVGRDRDADGGALWEGAPDLLKRSAALYRELGVPASAADAALLRARSRAPRGQQDVALADVEHALQWMREAGEPDAEERAAEVRREIEAQSVASSLSVSNEFRALKRPTACSATRPTCARCSPPWSSWRWSTRAAIAASWPLPRRRTPRRRGRPQPGAADRARDAARAREGGRRDVANGSALFASRVAADPRFHADLSGPLSGVFSLVLVPPVPVSGRRPGLRRPPERQRERRLQAA
jgi:hypothetical protein